MQPKVENEVSMQDEKRVPPHSMEAEQSVLGSMLLDTGAVIAAMETLEQDDFYSAGHRCIFEAMTMLYSASEAVDVVTVMDKLEQLGTTDKMGGMEYLVDLTRGVPTTTNVGKYISIVEDRAVLRGVISAGSDMVSLAFASNTPAEELVGLAHDSIFRLATRQRTDSLKSLTGALANAYARINLAAQSKGGLTGLSSGYRDLDHLTAGFSPEQLIVLAARPGKGKTSLALNMAHSIAVNQQKPVAIFSLEMSAEDLALRFMCADAEVSMANARSGDLTDEQFGKLMEAMRRLSAAPIFVDASGSATVSEIRARCMRLAANEKLGIVIIDYLQLMSSGKSRVESRQQEISELTRSMKMLARDVGAPVIILSQLNRDIERRKEKMPMLADLRESGSIEQDADMVLFLVHDEDLLDEDEDLDEDAVQNGAQIVLAKNRNGPVGNVKLLWLGEYTKFVGVSFRTE